jgi:hypothetical protein
LAYNLPLIFETIGMFMSMNYQQAYLESKFSCIHCGVYAMQEWGHLYYGSAESLGSKSSDFEYCKCLYCHKETFWFQGRMIIPADGPAPQAHTDTPQALLDEYNEARDIVARSPRAAAAIMRQTIHKLMPVLGQKGDNVNVDITALVKNGLPIEIQHALNYCRVIGTDATKPGEIDVNDNAEIACSLFHVFNFIIEDRISGPIKIKALCDSLPEEAREAIDQGDVAPNELQFVR